MTRPDLPRRLRRLCPSLLLGLITTWVMAWGLQLRADAPSAAVIRQVHSRQPASGALPARALIEELRFGVGRLQRSWWAEYHSPGGAVRSSGAFFEAGRERMQASVWALGGAPTWGLFSDSAARFTSGYPIQGGADQATGWPALAVWRGLGAFDVPPVKVASGTVPGVKRVLRLGWQPIWPGLAFNTAFYALLWWLGLASLRMVKHNRRYRRGLCPSCWYDLRADYSCGCPECGWGREAQT